MSEFCFVFPLLRYNDRNRKIHKMCLCHGWGRGTPGASAHLLGSGDSDRKQGQGLFGPADSEGPVGTPEAGEGEGGIVLALERGWG